MSLLENMIENSLPHVFKRYNVEAKCRSLGHSVEQEAELIRQKQSTLSARERAGVLALLRRRARSLILTSPIGCAKVYAYHESITKTN
jgi:hypothetical protein